MDPDRPSIGFAPDMYPDGAQVREALSVTYEETLARCRSTLQSMQTEPNEAMFGIVEEFQDRILRASGIKNEWQAIYQDLHAEIWADRFAALAERAGHLRAWNEATDKLRGSLGEDTDSLDAAGQAPLAHAHGRRG